MDESEMHEVLLSRQLQAVTKHSSCNALYKNWIRSGLKWVHYQSGVTKKSILNLIIGEKCGNIDIKCHVKNMTLTSHSGTTTTPA